MTKNSPTEVLLSVLDLLPSELNKFSFAFANKRHWRICSSPTADTLRLETSITALQLRKYCAFIVQDRYYDKKYMKHVFLHTANLHTITLGNRQKCTLDFTSFLLRSINMNKMVIFIVPESFERKLKFIVEEDEMDHVTIKISEDEQLIVIAKIVTPEAGRTQAERAKSILKSAYYLVNKETIVMKDNLSHMIASPINRFSTPKNIASGRPILATIC